MISSHAVHLVVEKSNLNGCCGNFSIKCKMQISILALRSDGVAEFNTFLYIENVWLRIVLWPHIGGTIHGCASEKFTVGKVDSYSQS